MVYELSIITICYNCENELIKTLNSVNEQLNFINKCDTSIEYIIVDGKSTDRTVEVAKKWDGSISKKNINVTIISELDNGIYDAMNKGIGMAKGKWILLLNAGDIFHSSMDLSNLLDHLQGCKADIVYAKYCRVNLYGTQYVTIPDLECLKSTMIFCHQATIVQRNLYNEYKYDTSYKLVADYAFFLKSLMKGKTFSFLDEYLIDYDINGISAKKMVDAYREIRNVRNNILGNKFSLKDNVVYCCGLIKRHILSNMPQDLRWRIIFFLRGLRSKIIT